MDEKSSSVKEPLVGTTPPQIVEDKLEPTTQMLRKIGGLAVYPIIGMIFHPAYLICNTVAFNQDPQAQAALAMGGLVLSIFLLSLGVTFNGSLDTLITQAYGQREFRLCRVYLNRQLYLNTIVFFVLAIPLALTKEMVVALGQTEETGRLAATYVHIMIPGVLTYSWQSCYSRYLSGQRITVVPMYANITATIVHVTLVLLLTVQHGMGITGVAIASSIQFFVRFLVTVTYVRRCGKFDAPEV